MLADNHSQNYYTPPLALSITGGIPSASLSPEEASIFVTIYRPYAVMAQGDADGVVDINDENDDDALESRLLKTILKLEEIDKNIYR